MELDLALFGCRHGVYVLHLHHVRHELHDLHQSFQLIHLNHVQHLLLEEFSQARINLALKFRIT
jgi:hypothetical protein